MTAMIAPIQKSEIKCPTPSCAGYVERYGESYQNVYPLSQSATPPAFLPDAIAQCQSCGGYTNGSEWKHVCRKCSAEVEPGALVGLFVPSRCVPCDEVLVAEEKAKGRTCIGCGKVSSRCYC